jgi:hypothetical protein
MKRAYRPSYCVSETYNFLTLKNLAVKKEKLGFKWLIEVVVNFRAKYFTSE